MRRVVCAAMLATLLATLFGCAPSGPSLTVHLAEGYRPVRSVPIDIATAESDSGLMTAKIGDHFGSPAPEGAVRLSLDAVHAEAELAPSHVVWQRWGATEGSPIDLVLLADVPGRFVDLPGQQEPRRLMVRVLPDQRVVVEVRPEGLALVPSGDAR